MNRLSLRTRLVAVAVALVAVAVVATGLATYAALSGFLNSRLDDQVRTAAGGPTPVCYAGPGGQRGGPNIGVWIGKLDATGNALTVSCATGVLTSTFLSPTDQDAVTLAADPGTVRTIRSTTGQEFRAIAVPSVREPDPVAWTVVALPTSDVSATLNRLLGLELIVGLAAVVGTGVIGAAGVRLGLRPLDRVTRTARTVAAELGPDGSGLDRRVPEADPHTEVGQLADAVNTMLGAVEREYTARYESEQRMRRFLADASHELRTPLTSLRGYAELVRLQGGLAEPARDSLRRIESEGTRMSRLVEDLLTLARSDRGVGPAERVLVDVTDVVDDAVAGLRAAHPEQEVTVTAPEPLAVAGDRDQLLQVVNNVLTNAAVHATGGGPIAVTAVREDGEVVVRVADSGPGLPPQQAAHVFDRFWRADAARTRVRGGSGLGLSIVQALAADHGGHVTFESDVARGTTVTVRLPTAPTHPDPSGYAPAPPPAPPP